MGKILRSFAPYEVKLPRLTLSDKRILPEVVIPRGDYTPDETAKGKRPVIELTDEQVARIEADEIAMLGFKASGPRGRVHYQWLDRMPESMRNSDDRVRELEQENARLRQRLREKGVDPGESEKPKKTAKAEGAGFDAAQPAM